METDFYKIAEVLAGRAVDQLIPCRNGRNSRVFKVVCGSDAFALKGYPSKVADPRDRFGTEIRALAFYEASNNPYTPRLLAVDVPRSIALMEWIDGYSVNAPDLDNMDQAVDFIARTDAAKNNGGDVFGQAAEPCLSGADLDRHIAWRLEKLLVVPELNFFLTHELIPVLKRARCHADNVAFSTSLPAFHQSLIPADFGFHNAIKSDSGRVSFIDFEYFGWDDPVRLTADFLLHPGTARDEECQNRFCRGMVKIFHADEKFERRLLNLLPLYGIRWALILLNEFLPERWQTRVFAGETASWEEIKKQQLKKARIAADKADMLLKLS